MRNARDEENNRPFSRERWFTKKKNKLKDISPGWLLHGRKGQETDDVDDQAELEHILGEQEENSWQLRVRPLRVLQGQ